MAQSNLFYGYYAVFMVVKSVYVLKSIKRGQGYNDILRIILFVLCLYILCIIAYFVLFEYLFCVQRVWILWECQSMIHDFEFSEYQRWYLKL